MQRRDDGQSDERGIRQRVELVQRRVLCFHAEAHFPDEDFLTNFCASAISTSKHKKLEISFASSADQSGQRASALDGSVDVDASQSRHFFACTCVNGTMNRSEQNCVRIFEWKIAFKARAPNFISNHLGSLKCLQSKWQSMYLNSARRAGRERECLAWPPFVVAKVGPLNEGKGGASRPWICLWRGVAVEPR